MIFLKSLTEQELYSREHVSEKSPKLHCWAHFDTPWEVLQVVVNVYRKDSPFKTVFSPGSQDFEQ